MAREPSLADGINPSLDDCPGAFIASMAAYVGVDAKREINFVTHPVGESARLLAEEKVDALMGFPPVPQELRQKKIGHVIVNSGLDRPWSQYFCCIVAGNREFVRRYPVATKRALRAIAKATNLCAAEPEQAARLVVAKGYPYDYALQTMNEISLRAVARLRSRGRRALLRPAPEGGGNDQVQPE
jgi:NitT/TauT family transport system substrate-binding protein